MFKYSCFTENSPENREHLEKIGYKSDVSLDGYEFPILIVNHDVVDGFGKYGGIESWMPMEYPTVYSNSINCTGNPSLFKALTAIRDNSDKHQYFVAHCYLEFTKKGQTDKKSVCAGELFVFMVESIDDVEFSYIAAKELEVFVHKASGEKLINNFKVD